MDGETGPAPNTIIWLLWALGWKNLTLLFVAGVTSIVLTALLVVRGRGTFAAAAMILAVSLPVWAGAVGGLLGLVGSYQHIGGASESSLLSEVADAIFASLAAPLCGLLLCLPSLVIALTGSTMRALAPNPDKSLWVPPPPKASMPPDRVWDDIPEISIRQTARD